jgi:hypothetical protein
MGRGWDSVNHTSRRRYNSLNHRRVWKLKPREFFKTTQWVVLNNACAKYIITNRHVHDPVFLNSMVPDEHYYVCALQKSPLRSEMDARDITFVNWKDKSDSFHKKHPKMYDVVSQVDLDRLRAGGYAFMRKISKCCILPNPIAPGSLFTHPPTLKPYMSDFEKM